MENNNYAGQNSDKNFLDRICVNYLRHNCINLKEQTGDECYKFFISYYEDALVAIYGKTGVREAYKLLSRKIYEKIIEIYPIFLNECVLQMEKKHC